MFNIDKFLQKFSKNIQDNQKTKQDIADIIQKHTGIQINPANLEIKNAALYISGSPALKNKIFIYKEKILEQLRTSNEKVKIINIQ